MYELSVDDLLDRLEAAGCRPRRSGHGWRAHCPLHDDHDPSLSIAAGPLVFCHGGCGREVDFFRRLLEVLEVPTHPARRRRPPAKRVPPRRWPRDSYEPISGAWVYADRAGRPLARKVRQVRVDAYSGERRREFRWQRPVSYVDGSGRVAWVASHGDVEPDSLPLWDLRQLDRAWAHGVRTVAVTEGESDCETLRALRSAATCAPNGSGPWRPQWTEELLRWPRVIVVVDNDPAGWRRGEDIRACLAHAEVLAPPEPYNDVTDLMRAGGTLRQLVPL